MRAKGIFDGMLRAGIAPRLRACDFRRKGHQFGRWVKEVWQVIGFPHGKWSTPEHYEFTVSLGVFSRRLFGFYGYKKTLDFPNEWDCHWRDSLEHLANRVDRFWHIEGESEVPHVLREVSTYLEEYALPTLGGLASDGALRDYWLTRFDNGNRNLESLRHLSVLLQRIGPTDRLPAVVQAMEDACRGLPCENAVREHKARLGLTKES